MNAVAEIVKDAAYWTENALEAWARWMSAGGEPRGLPDRASGPLENYTTLDAHNELAYDKLDAWLARTTNAAINDLVPVEQAALCRCYLQAVFRFPREAYEDVLLRARANVRIGLRRRGVWLGE